MLTFSKLQHRPRALQSLTGLSLPQFCSLLARFRPAWREAEARRLGRSDRRRAIGGGHPYTLEDADKLLLFLAICRHGLTYELAGVLFGLDTSNVCKLFKRLTPAVETAADPELATRLTDARQKREACGGTLSSFEAFLRVCPEFAEVAVDSSEHIRRRPQSKRVRKKCYSGKVKDYTIKTALVTSNVPGHKKRILFVSGSYDGPTPDNTIYQAEGLGDLIPRQTRQFLDLGYQGLGTLYPDHDLRLPFKRKSPGCRGKGKKGPPLTLGQKQANGKRRRRRVVAENALAGIRGTFRIMADVWRSRPERHNGVFRATAALHNFRLAA